MSTAVLPPPPAGGRPPVRTLADLLKRLGNVPLRRIRAWPPIGTATEADALAVHDQEGIACELVEGVLVEKPTAFLESVLAGSILALLRAFVLPRNLGVVSGGAGMMRLFPGLVRIPEVDFAGWDRFPDRRMPTVPVPHLVPDLAVEVLSEGNTREEMARKRRDYFDAGVRLVWIVDPRARTVAVYTSPDASVTLDADQTLDGGAVLPGFTLSLGDLFAELDRQAHA